MQQLECESNSITCMSCSYVHVYGNKVIYLSIYLSIYYLGIVIALCQHRGASYQETRVIAIQSVVVGMVAMKLIIMIILHKSMI